MRPLRHVSLLAAATLGLAVTTAVLPTATASAHENTSGNHAGR